MKKKMMLAAAAAALALGTTSTASAQVFDPGPFGEWCTTWGPETDEYGNPIETLVPCDDLGWFFLSAAPATTTIQWSISLDHLGAIGRG